jgi:hypothetical protein
MVGRTTRRRALVIVGSCLAVLVVLAAFLLLTVYVLDSPSTRVIGVVTSVEPAGSLVQLCVVDRQSGQRLCGETTQEKLDREGVKLNDCAQVEVNRGAVLHAEPRPCT